MESDTFTTVNIGTRHFGVPVGHESPDGSRIRPDTNGTGDSTFPPAVNGHAFTAVGANGAC